MFCMAAIIGAALSTAVAAAPLNTERAGEACQNIRNPLSAAITTTVRLEDGLGADWAGVVRWWLTWHVELVGFRRVYLYADSPGTVPLLRAVVDGHRNPAVARAVEIVDASHWLARKAKRKKSSSSRNKSLDIHDFIKRQVKNADDAYVRATRRGLGWLLNVDVDELFYIPPEHIAWSNTGGPIAPDAANPNPGRSLREHLRALDRWQLHDDDPARDRFFRAVDNCRVERGVRRISTARYMNMEVSCQMRPKDGGNYFTGGDTYAGGGLGLGLSPRKPVQFKVHPSCVGFTAANVYSDPRSPLVKLGFGPPAPGSGRLEYFFSYGNGKSIVRLTEAVLRRKATPAEQKRALQTTDATHRRPYPDSPQSHNHYWTVPADGPLSERGSGHGAQAMIGITGIMGSDATRSHEAFSSHLQAHGPFILHYVNCGFPFWLDKFVLLGKFHDGYMRKFTIPWDSMRGSRDVVLANAKGRKGRRGVVDAEGGALDVDGGGADEYDSPAARKFYTKNFVCGATCERRRRSQKLLLDIDIAARAEALAVERAGGGDEEKWHDTCDGLYSYSDGGSEAEHELLRAALQQAEVEVGAGGDVADDDDDDFGFL